MSRLPPPFPLYHLLFNRSLKSTPTYFTLLEPSGCQETSVSGFFSKFTKKDICYLQFFVINISLKSGWVFYSFYNQFSLRVENIQIFWIPRMQNIFRQIFFFKILILAQYFPGSWGWQNCSLFFDSYVSPALSDTSASGRKSLWVISSSTCFPCSCLSHWLYVYL